MLDDYFQHQADLSDLECNLRCPNDCSAPGCWMADVIVEVTLFDLIKLSQILNIPVSRLFSQHCRLGLVNCEFDLRYKKFLIKLKKPFTMRQLMKDLVRPRVVHRLENEHIKRLKRSLYPPAIHFM